MEYEKVFLMILIFFLYFLPTLAGKHQQNASRIMWINFLFGWTLVGWLYALVLAMEKKAVSN